MADFVRIFKKKNIAVAFIVSFVEACANLPLEFVNLDNANFNFLSLHCKLKCKLEKFKN